ncbi:MAG: FapA family protein [Firmicutes bacterium]|nr:FapA family protein [Bacillota bacterium]
MDEVVEPPQLADYVSVKMNVDRLRAVVDFRERPPADSGFVPTVQQFLAILRQHGVRYGVLSEAALQDVLDSWLDRMSGVVVAVGRPPTESIPETVTLHFDPDPQIRLVERDDGTVDFRELGIMQTAVAGQLLATKTKAIPGDPGTDVRNVPVLPKMPKAVPLPAGKGTQISDDGLTLTAAIDGQLSYGPDRRVSVTPILYVDEDVDFSVGNIDFIGTIVIRGNVKSGFTVKAAHDIEIYGIIEAADVSAGGNLTVRGGVQGSRRSRVQVEGNMRAMYLQNATVVVAGELLVSDSVMHSKVTAKRLRMVGKRGLLVGGETQVTESLFARVIGSHLSTATPIRLGYFPSAKDRLKACEQALAKLSGALLQSETERLHLLGLLRQQNQSGDSSRLLQLHEEVETFRQQIEQMEAERMQWEEVLGQPEPFLQIGGVAYPGVRLEASAATMYLDELTRPCQYTLTQDGFERRPVR